MLERKSVWQEMAERDLGVGLGQWQQLGGGDFAQSYRACVVDGESAELIRGDPVFIKTHMDPPARHFTTEARGLTWLQEAQAVPVPMVLGVSDDPPYLALQWIEEGQRLARGERQFGQSLARLHQAPCSHFGRLDERSTGSLGLPNAPGESWSGFFASQRLLPLARMAADRGALKASTIRQIETLANRLDEHVDTDVQPSRLHGDLWAGNRLVDRQGCSWLIDPASHGGHREFDLAMMRLFGGFSEDCMAAYQEHYPLADGWQDRISLHQLAPLIVHAIKFGRAYVGPTEEALDKYV